MIPARAFWLEAGGRGLIRNESLPDPPEGACVVRALFSAVSPGTERLIALGRVPASMYEEMRCPYMGGHFPFPVKYGYSLVGEVVSGPADLRGRTVHVLHPHQNICVVRREDVRPLPAGLPAERATLASNLETAVTAVWDSEAALGERVLVAGFGVVGSLIARLLSLFPAIDLEIVEPRRDRRRLAERMGFKALPEPGSGTFDLAFDASGAAAGLQAAVDRVGTEGRVVAVSWFGARPVPLALGGSFHSRRKKIVSSQVSRIPGFLGPRWDAARRTELVFRLLGSSEFDLHLRPPIPFSALPGEFLGLIRRPSAGLSPLIAY